ncbi:hypothetical protein [Streptomyces ardesiacus]|uniref:hypothetical protein n=1 Tax=Streptomyces ardesiacus TaxID=285564 RepID=UPI003F4A56F0
MRGFTAVVALSVRYLIGRLRPWRRLEDWTADQVLITGAWTRGGTGTVRQAIAVTAPRVMLHSSRAVDAKATAVPGMRVITPELFEKLKDAVTAFAAALASSPDRWADEQAVREQLAHHKLTGNRFFTAYAEPVSPS